jgi:membrane-associated phospholipid phosphatase
MIRVLTSFGLTRDSALFLWTKIASLAAMVVTGAIDPAALGLTDKQQHIAMVVCGVIAYLSGQLSTSSLPGALSKPSATAQKGIGVGVVLLASLLPAPCQAQAVAGDALVSPWPQQRQAANILSDVTVAADLALDTWASWRAPDRRQAFTKQAIRDGAILGVSELTKRLVHRTRPDGSDQLSFYSEHTAFAASAIGGPRLAFVLPLTLSTGYLRIAADKHYLTDTIVGALVGGLVGHVTR